MSLLNEDLANLCISGIMRKRVAEGDLPQDVLVNHAVNLLGTYLKLIDSARGATHKRPYYVGHALQGLRRMIDSGFITQDSAGNWFIVPENVDKLYELTEADLARQVEIAETRDSERARAYLDQARETLLIQDIIRRIRPDAVFSD